MDRMRVILLAVVWFQGMTMSASWAEEPGKAPAPQAAARMVTISPGYEERLLKGGFVKTEQTASFVVYGNKDITIRDLVTLLELKGTSDFKDVVNGSGNEWVLTAQVADNAVCLIKAPRPMGAPDLPPESTHVTARVTFHAPEPVPTVILRTTPLEQVYRALKKVGAEEVATSSWRVGGLGGANRQTDSYVLPDGTLLVLTLKLKEIGKEWEILKMSIGPKGKRYASESERAEDEKKGLIKETDKINIEEYKRALPR